MIHFAKRKIAQIVLIALVSGTGLFTAASFIYIRFHYAAVMPKSPQPQTGRIYPIKAQYEVVVYINKEELEWHDFVEYDLTSISGGGGLLLFLLGTRWGWFKKGQKFAVNPE